MVFGRSIAEAMARARASIEFGCLEPDRRPYPSLAVVLEPAEGESVGDVDRGLTVLSSLVAGDGTTPTTQPLKPTSPYSRDQVR
jgi:hypothetical protein